MTSLLKIARTFAIISSLLLVHVAHSTSAAEPVTLRLATSPVDGIVPVLYAQQDGSFERAGLRITIDKMGGGATLAAVAGGSIDLGKVGITSVIFAHVKHAPLVIAGAGPVYDPKTPDAVLAAAPNAQIAVPADLTGKTIAVSTLNDLSELAIRAWFDRSNVDWHGTQFIEVGIPITADAIEQGRVAAGVLVKPFTREIDSGKLKLVSNVYAAIAPRFLEAVWIANIDFLNHNGPAVASFQRAIAQGSAYANSHQPETANLLASFVGLEPAVAKVLPRQVTADTLDPRDVQPVIDAMVRAHMIDQGFDARDIIWPLCRTRRTC